MVDTEDEDDEYFYFTLYKTLGDKESGNYAAWSSGHIKDSTAVEVDYDYTITSSATQNSPVEEGDSITFTITRSDSGTASTVYVNTLQSTAEYNSDYTPLSQTINFAAYETEKTVTISTLVDTEDEDDEYFYLNLYKTLGDRESGNYAAWSSGHIKDSTSAETDYTYTVTSSADKASPTEEGGDITFTITRSDSGTASTVYLSTLGGNASNSGDDIDYKPLDKSALTFAAYETVKTVTINTYSDSLAEGDEYFWLDLYKTYADAESGAYAAYASGGIKDPEEAAVDYDYTITSSATQNSPVEEGDSITFTITRSDWVQPLQSMLILSSPRLNITATILPYLRQ